MSTRSQRLRAIASILCTAWLQGGCSAEAEQPPAPPHRALEERAASGGADTGQAVDEEPTEPEWQPGEGTYAPGSTCKKVELSDIPFGQPGQAAQDLGAPIAALRTDLLPAWTIEDLQPAFERIRDERFLCDPGRADFPRRLTWLDPRTGCEMRAELVSFMLAQWGYPRPFKIFLFGPLQVTTPNTVSGVAAWSWHVASAVRVDDRAYVLDAAVEPRRPLTLDEWTRLLVSDVEELEGVVCDAAAFQPASACFGGPSSTGAAIHFQQSSFASEWRLQLALGRDPERALADAPPWAL